MSVKFLFSTLGVLLTTLTFFTLDTIADTESTYDKDTVAVIIVFGVFSILILVAIFSLILQARKARPFLEEHSSLLSSEDPKVLLELSKKCAEYLKGRNSPKVSSLAQQAKNKREKIQQAENEREKIQREQAKMETFKSEISEDRSHPGVVATLKENMHNPDSFQHVSSDYEVIEEDGRRYHKIVMTFRATNTFNALVLQTCYFLIDENNQISLVGSADDTESSPVNTAALVASVDAAASAFEGAASLADLLLLFGSNE